MKKPVLNSAMTAALPESVEAGKAFVIQLAPKGEYPQFVDDPDNPGQQKEVVQILDDASIKTLVDNFKDKVLVDADHSSETSTNTRAYAWVTKLFVDPENGLMAEIEPTTVGASAINGKEYRFVSGAWTLDDDGRPQELVSIGLTNKPNLPVAPMINAQVAKKDDAGTAANAGDGVTHDNPDADAAAQKAKEAQSAANTDTGSQKTAEEEAAAKVKAEAEALEQKRKTDMDIRAKLGLPAEATDEEVEQAIDALLAKCDGMEQVANALGYEKTASNEEVMEGLNASLEQLGQLQSQNAEMEKAKLNAEADQLVSENEEVIPEEDVAAVKEQYVADPEAAKQTVANMRRVYERAVLNAAKVAPKKDETKKPVAINWAAGKKPVALNMESMLADCGGDPAKENELLRAMSKK